MGFHHPPTILVDDPRTQRHPLISPHIHQKMRKGVIGQKRLFKKILGVLQITPPSKDEGQTKPKPFSRTAVCFILTIGFSICSQWVPLSMAHTLWGVWWLTPLGIYFHQLAWWVGQCVGMGFVYFGFGQECVHDCVGVCAGFSLWFVFLCNNCIYLGFSMCPCWQGFFFSVILIYFLYCKSLRQFSIWAMIWVFFNKI